MKVWVRFLIYFFLLLNGIGIIGCTMNVELRDLSSSKKSLDLISSDKIAPVSPSLFQDMNFSSSTNSPTLSWLPGFDFESGVSGYQIAIGSSPGLDDVETWIDVGNTTSIQLSSLSLIHGQMYYPKIRTKDMAGNVSSPVNGDGFRAISSWVGYSHPTSWVFDEHVTAQAFQADGKMVVGGNFKRVGGAPMISIGLIQANGLPVDSFQKNPSMSGQILDIAVQADDKIIVAGEFDLSYAGRPYLYLVRFNTDGEVDSSFQFENIDNDIFSIDVQVDNKILVGGSFEEFDGVPQKYLVRLNSDGSRDSTFDIGTGPNNFRVTKVVSLPSGKVLIQGPFSTFNGTPVSSPLILNSNGSIDSTFNLGSGFSAQPSVIRSVSGGKILFCGGFTTYQGTSANQIIRLNFDGSVDASFGFGTGFNGAVYDCIVDSLGRIIALGQFTTYNGQTALGIARLLSNGSIDSTFNGVTSSFTGGSPSAVRQLSDGSYVVVGTFNQYNGVLRNRMARIQSDGAIFLGFDVGEGFNGARIPNLEVLSSDQIVLGSNELRTFGGNSINKIMRLNADHTLDSSFNVGSGLASDCTAFCWDVGKILSLGSGKILVGGYFQTYQGVSRNGVVRINSDGSLDSGFNPGTGINGKVYDMVEQPDGKVILGGGIISYNGSGVGRILRVEEDGARDLTYAIGSGFNGDVTVLASSKASGQIYVGGAFSTFNGAATANVIRLNSNGTKDATFDIGPSGFNMSGGAIKEDAKGRVLVGGNFTQLNGVSVKKIVRLLSSGATDPSFYASSIVDRVDSISIQSDGTIIVAMSGKLVRLNEDGSLDNTFVLDDSIFYHFSEILSNALGEIFVVGFGTSYSAGFSGGILKLGW